MSRTAPHAWWSAAETTCAPIARRALKPLTDLERTYAQHVTTLSNPFFEGRVPGSRGGTLAAEYIEFYFRGLGLKPVFEENTTPAQPQSKGEPPAPVPPIASATSKFDLSLTAERTPDGLRLEVEYNADVFDASTISRLADHWTTLLSQASSMPDRPVGALALMTPAELATRRQWNATA
mgnify:CR=1 FL=1